MTPDELLTEIYNVFQPFEPPPEGTYVNCEEVRGRWDVVRELGKQIVRSKQPTCQLYSGHRGVGKTTELLRLRDYLEGRDYHVVYFAVEDDVETQDAEYADILFACTKNLVQSVQLRDHNPLVEWMRERWQSLKDLALTDLEFDSLSLEQQVSQFAKITASVQAVPDIRRDLRKKLSDSTPSLLAALNGFIAEAQRQISPDCKGIVVIADNLDRIAENSTDGRSNFDEIYINRSEPMRGLACHVIYTVPIQMIYSPRVTRLEDYYSKPDVLPMVMVKSLAGEVNQAGVDKLREIICRRLQRVDSRLTEDIDTRVFDSAETLNRLCMMSGGHMRVLMQLLQRAMDWIDELPITAEAAQIAIEEQRNTYQMAIRGNRWAVLAQAHRSKQFDNEDLSLELLLNRCLVEYRYYDSQTQLRQWCDVHPLIEGFEPFKEALAKLDAASKD